MKKHNHATFAASTLLAAFLVSSSATASLQTGDIVSIGNGPGSPGGVFKLLDAGNNKITDTFCVQLDEYIRFGHTYEVAGLSKSSAGANPRPLTSFAAWLYDRFLNGVEGSGPALSNFDFANLYGATDSSAAQAQANGLQLAIWSAMGFTPSDIGGVGTGGWYDTYDDNLATWEAEFNADVASNGWSGTGNIHVVNLLGKDSSGNYTVHAQDQLIRQIVPEPATLLVWSALGAVGLIAARRYRS